MRACSHLAVVPLALAAISCTVARVTFNLVDAAVRTCRDHENEAAVAEAGRQGDRAGP